MAKLPALSTAFTFILCTPSAVIELSGNVKLPDFPSGPSKTIRRKTGNHKRGYQQANQTFTISSLIHDYSPNKDAPPEPKTLLRKLYNNVNCLCNRYFLYFQIILIYLPKTRKTPARQISSQVLPFLLIHFVAILPQCHLSR